MLTSDLLYEIAVELYRKATFDFNPPPDVVQRFKEYLDKETGMATMFTGSGLVSTTRFEPKVKLSVGIAE